MRKSCLFFGISATFFVFTGCETLQMPSAQAAPAPQMTLAQVSPSASAPSPNYRAEIANLRADIQALDRRVREMDLAMEELIRRNRELVAEAERVQRNQAGQLNDVVRDAQLRAALADLQKTMAAADADLRRQVIREVTQQIEQLGKQTQAAIDAVARSAASRPTVSTPPSRTTFSDDFPKEGISYVVKRGDTLSGIATRNNSTVRDIQNANQISDPGSIQVGQTLFIPQRGN